MTMLLKRYTVYGVMQEKTTFFITLAIWKIGPKLQLSSAYPAYLTFFYDDIQKLVNSIAHLYPSLSYFFLLVEFGYIYNYPTLYLHDIMILAIPPWSKHLCIYRAAVRPWRRPRPAGSSHRHLSSAAQPSDTPGEANGAYPKNWEKPRFLVGDFKRVID